ncbi:TetR/AcrR family transcriptional regulator [Phreatobacter sp.]|uniref:TetR/AcrR family transcriptional regulator n=1 Tax=Phreatobacter sp. TaxID=1966341 RepID=UPI003F710ABE
MARARSAVADLREACVGEAMAVIEQSGVEALSLREVARRLGVSHQAPYKHYPSRDHLLAEVVRRIFDGFARHLDDRPATDDPHSDLSAIGSAYLAYASAHPLQYRLMFATPLPDPAGHPDMMRSAQHAFAILGRAIARIQAMSVPAGGERLAQLDALYVWATVHGLASIMQSPAVGTLGLPGTVHQSMQCHAMARLHLALSAPPPEDALP